jgi:hypothetical protein
MMNIREIRIAATKLVAKYGKNEPNRKQNITTQDVAEDLAITNELIFQLACQLEEARK